MKQLRTITNTPEKEYKLDSPKSPLQYFKKIFETDKNLLITDLSSTNIQVSIPLKTAKEFLINFFSDENTKTQFLTYGSVAKQLSIPEGIELEPSDIDILCIHYSLDEAVSDFKQILNKQKIPHVNEHELTGNKKSKFIIQLQGQNYNLDLIDHVKSKIAYPPNYIRESQYEFTSENWEIIDGIACVKAKYLKCNNSKFCYLNNEKHFVENKLGPNFFISKFPSDFDE